MTALAAALAPVFLLIGLGYGLRRCGFLEAPFWAAADRLTFFVLFPALLVRNLATADLTGLPVTAMAAALAGAVAAIAGGLLALRRPLGARLGLSGPAFTSLFQGAIRPNTYVGLAAALALYGPPGMTAAAVAVAVLVPLVNLLSAAVLARHAGAGAPGVGRTAVMVARNPLILACLAGVALNWTGLGLPLGSGPVVAILGGAALPLGLLSVGAGLHVRAVRGARGVLLLASGCKLLVLPLIAVAVLTVLGIGGVAGAVTVLFAALPTSATSYVMARQMGGDHGLMAAIITVETVLAAVSLPALLIAFGGSIFH